MKISSHRARRDGGEGGGRRRRARSLRHRAHASNVSLALQKAQAVYEQAMLDSTLNLSKAREEMRTMELHARGEEARQGAGGLRGAHGPAAGRDRPREGRSARWRRPRWTTRPRPSRPRPRCARSGADRDRQQNLLAVVQEVMADFTIRAPAPGMVIYVKEWNGKKKIAGSQVNAWEPAVATLPDLTQMESITYVNEIDVRKIAVGQPVEHHARRRSRPSGSRARSPAVANMGEQRPNTDAKVFEVKVRDRAGRHHAAPRHDDRQRDRDAQHHRTRSSSRSRR